MWRDLQTRGFVVRRGFLTADDCAALLRDYEDAATDANRNYKIKTVGLKAFALVRRKLDAVAAEVRQSTDIHVDSFQGATYFANEVTSLDWHQEFEPFYLCADLYSYLNFYIPFVKEDPARSNVVVVPFDVVKVRDAGAYRYLLRGGARRFELRGASTVAHDSTTGASRTLALDLEAIGQAPSLGAGDLLVVRGDVVHRTQDTSTRRIAASFRMARGSAVVERKRLAECGPQKLQVMLRNRRMFECVFSYFREAGRDEVTVDELSKHLRTAMPKYVASKRGLARMLAEIAPRFHYRALLPGGDQIARLLPRQ